SCRRLSGHIKACPRLNLSFTVVAATRTWPTGFVSISSDEFTQRELKKEWIVARLYGVRQFIPDATADGFDIFLPPRMFPALRRYLPAADPRSSCSPIHPARQAYRMIRRSSIPNN